MTGSAATQPAGVGERQLAKSHLAAYNAGRNWDAPGDDKLPAPFTIPSMRSAVESGCNPPAAHWAARDIAQL
jgi:hypothetical protein